MQSVVQLVPGSIFANDFRVVRRLSEGGMGAVYLVEQLSTGKQRALKLMHPQLVSEPSLRKRFEQEAKIGSRIESDHVVEVLGAGVDAATQTPWLVMELLVGESLADYVARRGSLELPEVREILDQLCHALSAAHAQGIVHRDLKPENIFIASVKRRGVAFEVKVLDFGIAKVVAEAQTKATASLGTPMWMSPEQTKPGSQILPAADVWAVGLIVFWLITGRSYWLTARDESASTFMLMREILFEPLVPASERAAALASSVPPGFDAWFAGAVNRDVEPRFADAAAAWAALEPLLGPASAKSELAGRPPATVPTPRATPPVQQTIIAGPVDLAQVTVNQPATGPAVSVTSGAVHATRHAPQKSRTGMLVGLGAVALACAGVAIYVATKSPSGQSGEEAPDSSAPSSATTASKETPPPQPSAVAPTLASAIEPKNPLVEMNGVAFQQHPVTRAEYGLFLDSLSADDAKSAAPTAESGQGDQPVTWISLDRAERFCRAIGMRVPASEEWARAAAGKPWLTGVEEARPIQELTRTIRYGLVVVRGAPATMKPADRAAAAKNEFPVRTAATSAIGFRCARDTGNAGSAGGASSDASPRAEVFGRWKGKGCQASGECWTIDVTLDQLDEAGSPVGTIAYPSLNCWARLEFARWEESTPVFRERYVQRGTCIPDGWLWLQPDSGSLAFKWAYPNGKVDAKAKLERAP